jgi:hypothetical protein
LQVRVLLGSPSFTSLSFSITRQRPPLIQKTLCGRGSLYRQHARSLAINRKNVKVLYIEKPNGDRFELDAIKAWCDAQP